MLLIYVFAGMLDVIKEDGSTVVLLAFTVVYSSTFIPIDRPSVVGTVTFGDPLVITQPVCRKSQLRIAAIAKSRAYSKPSIVSNNSPSI